MSLLLVWATEMVMPFTKKWKGERVGDRVKWKVRVMCRADIQEDTVDRQVMFQASHAEDS